MVSLCCRQEGTWLPVCSRAPGLLVRLGPLSTNTKAGSSLQGCETGGEKQGWVVRGCLLPMAACHHLEMPCRGRKHLLAETTQDENPRTLSLQGRARTSPRTSTGKLASGAHQGKDVTPSGKETCSSLGVVGLGLSVKPSWICKSHLQE